jgi:hypothetical protein
MQTAGLQDLLLTVADSIPVMSRAALVGVVALIGSSPYERGEIPLGALLVAVGQDQALIDPLGRLARTRPDLAAARASATRICRS